MNRAVFMVAVAVLLLVASLAGAAGKVSLPKGYEKWEKSKEKVVSDKNSLFYGIHYTYVDKKAWPAFKSGGKYPEGSRFVVVFYNIREEGGKPVRGKKNMIVLMEKNRKYAETGGWLFAGYGPDGKPSAVDPVKNCFECHLKEAKGTDYVISKYADFR
ncbi:MAG: cytochrome P460 family protein [Geobacteraceae bacterium]|nr:cytochrome P460 family protein [Geobacteraceae bacterium]